MRWIVAFYFCVECLSGDGSGFVIPGDVQFRTRCRKEIVNKFDICDEKVSPQ